MKNNPADPTKEMRKIALDEWMQAGSGIKQRIQQILVEDEVHFEAYRILELLAEVEGRSLYRTTLAETLHLKEEELDGLLGRMQADSWVDIYPTRTHGNLQVSLTPAGSRLFYKIDRRISLELAPIAAQFNAKEIKLMRLILNKMRAVFTPASAV
jgi:DNA-binding MarR family transcriptional regulator